MITPSHQEPALNGLDVSGTTSQPTSGLLPAAESEAAPHLDTYGAELSLKGGILSHPFVRKSN